MAKASRRAVAAKIKTAVLLSPEATQRLGAACLREGKTQSAIVEELIGRALHGYTVTLRGPGLFAGPGQSTVSAIPADRVESVEATAA